MSDENGIMLRVNKGLDRDYREQFWVELLNRDTGEWVQISFRYCLEKFAAQKMNTIMSAIESNIRE